MECFKQSNIEKSENSNSAVDLRQYNVAHSIKIIGKKLDAMVAHFDKCPLPADCPKTNEVDFGSKNTAESNMPVDLSTTSLVCGPDPNELPMLDCCSDKCNHLNNSGKSLENNWKTATSDRTDVEVQPVKVTMRSGRISKPNKCKSEFVYFNTKGSNCKKYFDNKQKHSLHSKCKAAISHKCLTSTERETLTDTDEEGSSKDKLLNIFGSDFDFDGWLSANEIDISIEDLDLTGFDDFEGVLPENRTLTIENLIEDLEAAGSTEFSDIAGLNSLQSKPFINESFPNPNGFISHIMPVEASVNEKQSNSIASDCLIPESKQKHVKIRNVKIPVSKCNICKKPFKTKKSLLSHMKKFHCDSSWKKFQCSTCGEKFEFLKTFDRHIKKHNPASKFVCDKCGKIFINLINLKTHQAVHDKTISYECPNCHKIFYHKYSYSKHLKLHDPQSIHRCTTCQKTFANRSKHKSHMKLHEFGKYLGRSDNYKCNACGDVKSLEELNFANPAYSSHYVTCNHCKRGLYKRYLNLNRNTVVDIKLEERRIKDSSCVKETVNLQRGTNDCIRSQTVKCEICSKSLKQTSLKSHMYRKHLGNAVVCEHCNKVFKNIMSLQEHTTKLRKEG